VQEKAAGNPPQHVLLRLRKQSQLQDGSHFFKGNGLRAVNRYQYGIDAKTWLKSPMCAKNCEPLEVPDTNILVFYSKKDFYPVVIRTQSEKAMLNTVLYLEKGLREYCLCNVKNSLTIFIIDVIDQCPIIERVKLAENNYIYASFLPLPFSYAKRKSKIREKSVSRRTKLENRLRDGPITRAHFTLPNGELSCTGYH
jgi:hypothetical protein